MLTWKRTFIAAAILANLVVFVGLGGVFLFEAMSPPSQSPPDHHTPSPILAWTLGTGLVAIGAVNLLCIYFAHAGTTGTKVIAIALGTVLCVLLAIGTVVIMTTTSDAVVTFILGTVVFTTAGALWNLSPRPTPDWRCQHCDYDLRGLAEANAGGENGVCPECGTPRPSKAGP